MHTHLNYKRYLRLLLLGTLFCNLAKAQEGLYISPGSQMMIDTATIFTSIGNVTLEKGAELMHDGIFYVTNSTAVSGWSDPGGSFGGLGMVIFQGARAISYSGATRFHDLTVNGGPINFAASSKLTVSNQLILQLGVINTGSDGLLQVSNPSVDALVARETNTSYSKSYINGSLKRNIDVNQLSYDFPVGNTAGARLLSFRNNLLTGVNGLTASFGAKKGDDSGIKEANVAAFTSVNPNGVWFLDPEGKPSGGSYGLRLSLAGFTGLIDNEFSILARPLTSANGADWVIPSGSILPETGLAGRTLSSGFTQRDNFVSLDFSQFGIGMSSVAPFTPDIRLFPNPSSGMLNINVPTAQEYTLIVWNADGKKVLQQKMVQTTQIRLDRFHPGTYTVSLYGADNKHVVSKKVILIK